MFLWKIQLSFRNRSQPLEQPLSELIRLRAWPLVVHRTTTPRGRSEARVPGPDGRLPIHPACCYGAPLRAIDALLEAYQGGARHPDEHGFLPLHVACQDESCSAAVVQSLLAAHPGGVIVPNRRGDSCIHIALSRARPAEVVRVLLNVHPPLAWTWNADKKHLPIHRAAMSVGEACVDVIQLLLQAYPDGSKTEDYLGRLPLHCACYHGGTSLKVVQTLLDSYPLAVSHVDHQGALPLHSACYTRHPQIDVISALLTAHPQAAHATDNIQRLPLHAAFQYATKAHVAASRGTHLPPKKLVMQLLDVYPDAARIPLFTSPVLRGEARSWTEQFLPARIPLLRREARSWTEQF